MQRAYSSGGSRGRGRARIGHASKTPGRTPSEIDSGMLELRGLNSDSDRTDSDSIQGSPRQAAGRVWLGMPWLRGHESAPDSASQSDVEAPVSAAGNTASTSRRQRDRSMSLREVVHQQCPNLSGEQEYYWSMNRDSMTALEGVFHQLFDKDHDNELTAEELLHVLTNLGESATAESALQMVRAGSGGTEVMSKKQFVQTMTDVDSSSKWNVVRTNISQIKALDEAVGTETHDVVKDMFELIDEDGSGALDEREVSKLAVKLGDRMKRRHLIDAMAAMDPDQIGEVTLPMFRTWWFERQHHWTDLLVLPESLVQLVRSEVGTDDCDTDDPVVMWRRLSRLLKTLVVVMKQRADVMSMDPNNMYGGSKDEEDDELEVELEARAKSCFLHPTGKTRQVWDAAQIVLLTYVLIFVPYRTCFDDQVVLWSGFFWFEIFVDVYFFLDVFMNFRTGFYDRKSSLVLVCTLRIVRVLKSTPLDPLRSDVLIVCTFLQRQDAMAYCASTKSRSQTNTCPPGFRSMQRRAFQQII